MKYKHLLWIFALILLVIPMAHAEESDTTQVYSAEPSVQIEYPKEAFYQQGEPIQLNFDVHNSTAYELNDSQVDCEVSIHGENGKTISHGDLIYNDSVHMFEYNLNSSQTQRIGTYDFFAYCNSTQGEAGFVSGPFEVTENGMSYQTSDGVFYLTVILFAVISSFMFIGFGVSEVRFAGGDFLNLVLNRSSIVLGFLLLTFTSTMLFSIQEAIKLNVGVSMYRFIWIFLISSLLMMIYTVVKTLFDVIEMYGQKQEKKRMGGDL